MKTVKAGRIIGAHGLRGEVKLKSDTADPFTLFDYQPFYRADGHPLPKAIKWRGGSKHLLVVLDGVRSREAAEALRGVDIHIEADKLPEPDDEEYYYSVLEACEVRLAATGEVVGNVLAIHNFGAGDIVEIAPVHGGKPVMYAFTEDSFPEINPEEGYITFDPPEEWEVERNENDEE